MEWIKCNDTMHLIINFGDFDCLGDPHASLPLRAITPTTTLGSVGPPRRDGGWWLPMSVLNHSTNCYTEFKNSLEENCREMIYSCRNRARDIR